MSSESVNNNGRSSRRKPLKTTRILAEETESYYVNNDACSLRDTLLSEYESGDIEHQRRCTSPLLTESGSDNNQAFGAAPVVINSSSSDDVTFAGRGRPLKSHARVDGEASRLLPIDECNVGPVLEKLLAMMQSMSMLLSALKNDLRHSSMPEVVAKKRDAATTQLWRAFMAYQRSFAEIEQFACSSKNGGQLATKLSACLPSSQSRANQSRPVTTAKRSRCMQIGHADVIELSGSESEDDVKCKRSRSDAAGTDEETAVSSAAAKLGDNPSLLVTSLRDSSQAPSASTSNVSYDTSASCVCVDPPTDSPNLTDACRSDLPESLSSEPLCDSDPCSDS